MSRSSLLRLCTLSTVWLVTSWAVSAQVIEIRGGQSSLYQAGGGSVALHEENFEAVTGAGIEAGRLIIGARLERSFEKARLIVGDDQIKFTLPTDIFGSSPYLYTRGVSLATKAGGTDYLLFGGLESNVYSTPLFTGGTQGAGLAFLSAHRRLSEHWDFYSNTILSRKQSEIIGLQWHGTGRTAIAVSGGMGANHPYGAASVSIERRWMDLKAAYIQAGRDFQRIAFSNPVFAEPSKGNVLLTLRPTRFLSLIGGTQSYLVPVVDTNGRYNGQTASSSAAQVGATLTFRKASVSGSLYQSKYQGEVDHAFALTAQRPLSRRVHVMSTWMASRPQESRSINNFLTTVNENLTPRFSLNQSVSISGGTTNFLYGGSLDSNLISVSASYESFYVPALTQTPFQNALLLDVNIHLFGRARFHAQTFVGPTGRLLYTTDAYAVASRDTPDGPEAAPQRSIGDYELTGRVVDGMDLPVEGAALMIDQAQIYTDSEGRFSLREHKPQTHRLAVLIDQFLGGGIWSVVAAPASIRSSDGGAENETRVIVRRAPNPQGSN